MTGLQEDSRLIVMTTKEVERGKTKCARYWPEPDSGVAGEEYGVFRVLCTSQQSSKDYTLREFSVSREGEQNQDRTVFHFHFLGWPGKGDTTAFGLCCMLLRQTTGHPRIPAAFSTSFTTSTSSRSHSVNTQPWTLDTPPHCHTVL